MKRTFLKHDRAKALRTIKLDGVIILERGKEYEVKSVHFNCCRQSIGIGYVHPKRIVNACAVCGNKRKEKVILFPSRYFTRVSASSNPIDDIELFLKSLYKRHF